MPNGFFFKGPAGSAAGPAGPQQQRYQPGLPPQHLPGYTNARTAEHARRQVAGTADAMPDTLSLQERCFVEYMARRICDCLIDGLVNIQQVARGPSHIMVPYNGVCFARHIGSGADPTGIGGHPDLPVPLPFSPGGPFTTLVDFTVEQGQNGVLNAVGVNLDPSDAATRGGIEFRIRVNDQVVTPFDAPHGAVVSNAAGAWWGMPGTVENPFDKLCVNLFPGDTVRFEARNSFIPGPPTPAASAIICGWTYYPTMQTSDRTIRGTLTDQR
jgi:hypothetical protein